MLDYQKQNLKNLNSLDQKFWLKSKKFIPKKIQNKIERLHKKTKLPYKYLLFIEMTASN